MTHTGENPLGAQRVHTNALNMHEIIYTVEKAFKVISFDKNLFNIRYVKET